jgi:PAS domain S-box-containing protein
MKTKHKIVALSIAFGLSVWVIDAYLDYVVFYEGTFWELLITNMPARELYIRTVILTIFIVFAIIVCNIMAKREKTEQILRESEYKYPQLIQESLDAVISLDKTGNFLSFNPAAEHMSGFSAQEVLDGHFARIGILAKKSIPKAIKEFGLVLTGAERPPFELTILHKDKGRVCLEANPRRVKHKGKETWVEVTLRDITERKQAEQAMEEWKNRYETAILASGHLLYDWNSGYKEKMGGISLLKTLDISLQTPRVI